MKSAMLVHWEVSVTLFHDVMWLSVCVFNIEGSEWRFALTGLSILSTKRYILISKKNKSSTSIMDV